MDHALLGICSTYNFEGVLKTFQKSVSQKNSDHFSEIGINILLEFLSYIMLLL